MLKTLVVAVAGFLFTTLVFADSGDGGGGATESGDGGGSAGATTIPLPPVSGELEKLPKELTSGKYECGEYFAGRVGNDPDILITFALKKKEVVGGEVTIAFIMTKKNLSVIRDDKRTVPFATVKMVGGLKKVEVKVPTTVMSKATCLPKPRGLKDA